ncbi:MAG: flagellar protein FlgN [Oscillospiraceae bacterium]|nr:flagellar protein FlgN [Oscillospiraceae bacterium]
MNKDVTQLLKCLNTHKHLYGILLEKCEEKRRVIIANDINKLEELLAEEQDLIKRIEAVEGLRIKYSQEAAARLGLKKDASHDEIMARDKEAAAAFGNVSTEIKALLTRLKDLNGVNNALIQKRLIYIEDIKSSFFDDRGSNYGSDGKDSGVKIQNLNLFDRMV